MLYDIKKKLKTGINNSIKNDFVAFVGLIVSLLIIVYGYYKFVLKTSIYHYYNIPLDLMLIDNFNINAFIFDIICVFILLISVILYYLQYYVFFKKKNKSKLKKVKIFFSFDYLKFWAIKHVFILFSVCFLNYYGNIYTTSFFQNVLFAIGIDFLIFASYWLSCKKFIDDFVDFISDSNKEKSGVIDDILIISLLTLFIFIPFAVSIVNYIFTEINVNHYNHSDYYKYYDKDTNNEYIIIVYNDEKAISCLYELKQNNEKIVNCDKEIKLVYLTDITLYK